MTTDGPRLPPRPESDWDDETRELLERTRFNDGEPLHIFSTLAHHPKLLKRWMVFGNHLLFKGALPARDRELLILRTAINCRADYEWGQHVPIAHGTGIDEAEVAAVVDGPDHASWSDFDRALLRAADELHTDYAISDATWNALSARYSVQELIEVPFTVGQYHMVAMALKTLGVEREPGVTGLPAPG